MSFEKPIKNNSEKDLKQSDSKKERLVQVSENKWKIISAKEFAEMEADLKADKERKDAKQKAKVAPVKEFRQAQEEKPTIQGLEKSEEKSPIEEEFGIPKPEKVLEGSEPIEKKDEKEKNPENEQASKEVSVSKSRDVEKINDSKDPVYLRLKNNYEEANKKLHDFQNKSWKIDDILNHQEKLDVLIEARNEARKKMESYFPEKSESFKKAVESFKEDKSFKNLSPDEQMIELQKFVTAYKADETEKIYKKEFGLSAKLKRSFESSAQIIENIIKDPIDLIRNSWTNLTTSLIEKTARRKIESLIEEKIKKEKLTAESLISFLDTQDFILDEAESKKLRSREVKSSLKKWAMIVSLGILSFVGGMKLYENRSNSENNESQAKATDVVNKSTNTYNKGELNSSFDQFDKKNFKPSSVSSETNKNIENKQIKKTSYETKEFSNGNSKLVFGYDKKGNIVDVKFSAGNAGSDVLESQKLLKPDWFKISQAKARGTQNLALLNEGVKMQVLNIYKLNKQLNKLNPNSKEYKFLNQHIAKEKQMMEKRYGDIFNETK